MFICMVTLLGLSKPPWFCCMFLCVCPYKSAKSRSFTITFRIFLDS